MQADSRQSEKLQALADAMKLLHMRSRSCRRTLPEMLKLQRRACVFAQQCRRSRGKRGCAEERSLAAASAARESTRVASASIEESKGLQASLAKNAEVHSAEVASLRVDIEGQKVTEATLRERSLYFSRSSRNQDLATRRSEDVEGLRKYQGPASSARSPGGTATKAQEEAATALSRKAGGSFSGKSEEGGSGPTINDLRRELAEKDAVHEGKSPFLKTGC